jgi:LacI family transcriptional regulator
MVTLKTIAREAGVSVPTVSQVLNGNAKRVRISESCVERVQSVAARMNFRPNGVARAMRLQKTRQIGVLLRNAPDERFTNIAAFEIILGINETLEAAGYVLSVVRMGDVADETKPGSRVFHEHLLDGLIVVGRMPDEVYAAAEKHVTECVWLDANIWRDRWCLRRDEVDAGRKAGAAAAALGYKRVILVGNEPSRATHYSHEQRLSGAEEAATEAGASVERVVLPVLRPNDVYPVLTKLIRGDTALVAVDAPVARHISHAATSLGRSAGWDFGLICCEETQQVQLHWPNLSRVTFDRFGLGVRAAELILRRLGGTAEHSTDVSRSQLVRGEWRPGDTAWGPGCFRDVLNFFDL